MGGAAAGAVASALVFVGVYEGRVRLSHARGPALELAAGERARSGPSGWQKVGGPGSARTEAGGSSRAGNRELLGRIRELRRELLALEQEKADLERALAQAPAGGRGAPKPASAGGSSGPRASDFDLSPADWARLAEEGTVKYRVPCYVPGGWKPDAARLERLGLSPDDGAALTEAYSRSNQRVWDRIAPLCSRAVGSREVAEKLGNNTCIHSIVDVARQESAAATGEAWRAVGEIRAGQRPPPAEDAAVHPVLDAMLTLTGELSRFQADLAEQFGPEEARRLAFSDDLCASSSTFSGPGKKPPAP
jgi:hypothetical protein